MHQSWQVLCQQYMALNTLLIGCTFVRCFKHTAGRDASILWLHVGIEVGMHRGEQCTVGTFSSERSRAIHATFRVQNDW